jgi:hypothetical protein
MMAEDAFKIVSGALADGAHDVLDKLADFVKDTAKEELERRHPGISEEKEPDAFSRAITSDELDAQLPKS